MSNKLSINKVALSVILATGAIFTSPIWAANFYVSNQRSDSHFNTLKDALAAARASQDATNTIFLHKNVTHNYAQDNNGNSNFIFNSALTIDGSGADGNARHTIDFTGINNISLTKDLELKNVHLVIQPLDSSLASAIAGAGSGQANELDPKIYLNGYKLTLDNVDTNSTKLHAKTRPNIYLGSDGSTDEQGGQGELLVMNSKPTENPATVLKNIILGNGNTKVTLNTKSDVLGSIHFSTDKNNNEAINGTVDLIFDSYRKQLNFHKPQGSDPTINLSLTDFKGKDIPATLTTLNNLTLNNSTPNVKHTLTVTKTLTLENNATITSGDGFSDDDSLPSSLTIKDIVSNGGTINIEDNSSVSITGNFSGSSLSVEGKAFTFTNKDSYSSENTGNRVTYKPSPPPMDRPKPPQNDPSSNTGGSTPPNNNAQNGSQPQGTTPSSPGSTTNDNEQNGSQPGGADSTVIPPKEPEEKPKEDNSSTGSDQQDGSTHTNEEEPKLNNQNTPSSDGTPTDDSKQNDPQDEEEKNSAEISSKEPNDETLLEEGNGDGNSDSEIEETETDSVNSTSEESESSNETTNSTEESTTETATPETSAPEREAALNVVQLKPTFEFIAPQLLLNQLQNPNRAALSRITSEFSGDNVWVEVENHYAKQKETNRILGYQMKEAGIALGAETEVAKGKLGVSLSYSHSEFSHLDQGKMNSETWQTFMYANTHLGNMLTYGYAGIGHSDATSQNLVQTPKTQFYAISTQAGIGVGYPVTLFEKASFMPTLETNYTWLRTSARVMQDFTIPASTLQSLIIRSGVALSLPISEHFTLNTLATIGVETFNQNLRASYVNGQTLYQMESEQPHRTSGQLGLSMSYKLTPATELEAGYQAELKKGYHNHKGNLSLKVTF